MSYKIIELNLSHSVHEIHAHEHERSASFIHERIHTHIVDHNLKTIHKQSSNTKHKHKRADDEEEEEQIETK